MSIRFLSMMHPIISDISIYSNNSIIRRNIKKIECDHNDSDENIERSEGRENTEESNEERQKIEKRKMCFISNISILELLIAA